MPRYAVLSQGLPLPELEAHIRRLGGKDLRAAPSLGQVFCDLEEEAAGRLSQVPGLAVRPVGRVKTQQVLAPPAQLHRMGPVYAASQAALSSLFYQLREAMAPPLLGSGVTVAVLDSGIRTSHRALAGKVVTSANLTSSPTSEDLYDHGTGVAFLIAGGRHAPGEEAGLAPGAALVNIKVLEDDGEGSVESVVLGLEEAVRMRREGLAAGLPPTDPRVPNGVNMSFGAPDDGDPDHPLRAAARAASAAGLGVVAAAGNAGPAPSSVMVPATDPAVFAVGAVTFLPFALWERSSRGPTREGLTKPDAVFYGVDLLVASARGDTSFEVKAGTSFAAPCLAGAAALAQEGALRVLGRGATPEDVRAVMPLISRKPPGVPLGKDNDYGWGMPMGDLLVRLVQPTSPMAEIVTPILGLALMAGVLRAALPGSSLEGSERRAAKGR